MDENQSSPEPDSRLAASLASFYYVAEEGPVEEEEISPSLHAVSQISKRYESAEFIAKGGMKQVFKVHDARCKRHVAMATLHDDAPIELCDPLIHEAWLTALLDHPNIITIHDVGVDDRNRPYFTMDLKTGDSLGELIEKLREGEPKIRDRYPLESLLQMFVKICDAIAYAHSVQVLHLDLKPANIQVGEYGEVLVCDWGLGRVHSSEEGIEFERLLLHSDLLSSGTLFGQVRGTPGYIAPEQIDKDGTRNSLTDIYQLGCILYTILTLQSPLNGESTSALEKAARGEVVPPQTRAPDRNIPPSLQAVALKAMDVDPGSRYSSVESLGEEIRLYLRGFATAAEDAGVLTQMGLIYRRNRRFCNTVLCAATLLFCGATWSYWKLAEKERIASAAHFNAEQALDMYAHSLEKSVIEMHLGADEKTSEKLLLAALAANPDNPVYLRAMGEHYFIVQRFNKASKFLKRGEKRSEHPDQLISDLAQEYALQKPDDDEQLATDQMIGLLRRIEDFDGFEAMIVLNDHKRRVDTKQRAVIIEEHLRSINPEWNDGWFDYDSEESRLRIGGKGLKRLSYSGSILAGLQARHLDISESEVDALWKETGYAIETLDIRGCPFSEESLSVLFQFVHLRELTIHPGQLTSDQLKQLSGRFKVIEKERVSGRGE